MVVSRQALSSHSVVSSQYISLTSVVDAVLAAAVAVRVAAVAEVGAAGPLAALVARGGFAVLQGEAGTAAAIQTPRGPGQTAACPQTQRGLGQVRQWEGCGYLP